MIWAAEDDSTLVDNDWILLSSDYVPAPYYTQNKKSSKKEPAEKKTKRSKPAAGSKKKKSAEQAGDEFIEL